jgi:hypothetical protein
MTATGQTRSRTAERKSVPKRKQTPTRVQSGLYLSSRLLPCAPAGFVAPALFNRAPQQEFDLAVHAAKLCTRPAPKFLVQTLVETKQE